MADRIALDIGDIRVAASFAADEAALVLDIFEQVHPNDSRPREAIAAAFAFAAGGARSKGLRDAAWAAHKAARETEDAAAGEAARSAMSAAAAAFLHPLADATQVKHILGAAVHAILAAELAAGGLPDAGAGHVARVACRATPRVVSLLKRYPLAPPGGGRAGELLRALDRAIRDGML